VIERIVSGGQAGVDRAALDFAIAHNIPHGGWCPHGRWAEDGPIPELYQLKETPDSDPAQRTEWNVRDSDATVVLSIWPELSGGSKQTVEFALRQGKPCIHLCRRREGEKAAAKLAAFLKEHDVKTLNVAGPRQSEETEAGSLTRQVLEAVLLRPPAKHPNHGQTQSSRAKKKLQRHSEMC
jgi:hypothetical protein